MANNLFGPQGQLIAISSVFDPGAAITLFLMSSNRVSAMEAWPQAVDTALLYLFYSLEHFVNVTSLQRSQ